MSRGPEPSQEMRDRLGPPPLGKVKGEKRGKAARRADMQEVMESPVRPSRLPTIILLVLIIAMLGGMIVAGGTAVGLERVAYRPLRKRGAPSLVFLITAIGMSFVLQEFVHFVLPKLTGGTLGGVNAQQPIRLDHGSSTTAYVGGRLTFAFGPGGLAGR